MLIRNIFLYTGGGNVLLNNFTMNAYFNIAKYHAPIAVFQDDRCFEVDEDHSYKTEVYNFGIYSPPSQYLAPYQQLNYVAFGSRSVSLGPFHDLVIENITLKDAHYTSVGPFYFPFSLPMNVSISNVKVENFKASVPMFYFVSMNRLIMNNISFDNGEIGSTHLLRGDGLLNVDIDGFYFNNVTYTSTLKIPMMDWKHYSSLRFNNIGLFNTTLSGVYSLYHFTTDSSPSTVVNNVTIEDCSLSDTSVLSVGSVIDFSLTNLALKNVRNIDTSGSESKIIDLGTLSSVMDNQISIKDVYGYNTSVGILHVSNSGQLKTIVQRISVTTVKLEN